jgi:steroid 5-alpha reductase family enzyme
MSPLLTNLAVTGASVLVLMAAAAVVGTWVRGGRHDGVDVAWGAGFVLVAVLTWALSAGHAEPGRRWLVTVLTAVWGLRLTWHIARRARGHPEDPRYQRLLARAPGNRDRYALLMVYLPQAVLLWLVSLPVQLAQYGFDDHLLGGTELGCWLGAPLWALGLVFEVVGDHQLTRFRADPANAARVLDTGLWRYTRHPNYFGDAAAWTGFYLIAAEHWIGALTIASPVLMSWFLSFKTGKPLLEKQMAATKPGYAEYIRRTSGFFPLPPKPGL